MIFMNNLRLILTILVFINFNLLYADQIDIGIFESTEIPGQIDIKIRPDFDIYTPQTITAILYTLRWDDPSLIITTQSFYPFFINPIDQPEEYNGYYYQSFAAVPFISIALDANQEILASSFTYTNGECATFEIIEDEWTAVNNGNVYMEFIGSDVTGIIYMPIINFGSIGGYVTGNDTINLGNTTGPLNLINYQGNILTWQRKIDENPWVDIPGTSGLSAYSETPSTIGSYSYGAKVQNGTCPELFSQIFTIQVISNNEFSLDIKVFLEGNFEVNQMGNALYQQGYIPSNQPYSGPPWNYLGTESAPFLSNPNVVDWILVELRETAGDASTATSSKRVYRQAGLLLNNGNIVQVDGVSNLSLNIQITENLYIVIWHRNHINVMSAFPLIPVGNILAYDFSSGETQVYGGASGHKELFSGIWGMIGGDGNGDVEINNGDIINLWSIQAGNKGYLLPDFNMDAQITNQDKNDIWFINNGAVSQVPE